MTAPDSAYQPRRDALISRKMGACVVIALQMCIGFPAYADQNPDLVIAVTRPSSIAPTTSAAGETCPALDAAGIRSVIAKLGDPDWRVRSQSQERLAELGEQARPALEESLKVATSGPASVEARERVTALLKALDDAVRPTLITVHGKAASVQLVCAEIATQVGINLKTDESAGALERVQKTFVDISVEKAPFWEVMQALCRAADLHFEYHLAEKAYVLKTYGVNWSNDNFAVHGPLAIAATDAGYTSKVVYGDEQYRRPPVNFFLQCYAEPKLKIVYWVDVHSLVCTDEHGATLTASLGEIDHVISEGTGDCVINVAISEARQIGRLKAAARFLVSAQSRALNLSDVIGGKRMECTVQRTDGALGLSFSDFRTIKLGQYSVLMSVPRKGRDSKDWDTLTQQLRACRWQLKDAKGESIADAGEPAVSKRDTEAEITFSFNAGRAHGSKPPEAPVQLTIEVPTEVKEIEFPFELTNLPMP